MIPKFINKKDLFQLFKYLLILKVRLQGQNQYGYTMYET